MWQEIPMPNKETVLKKEMTLDCFLLMSPDNAGVLCKHISLLNRRTGVLLQWTLIKADKSNTCSSPSPTGWFWEAHKQSGSIWRMIYLNFECSYVPPRPQKERARADLRKPKTLHNFTKCVWGLIKNSTKNPLLKQLSSSQGIDWFLGEKQKADVLSWLLSTKCFQSG